MYARLTLVFLAGLLFGLGLAISGMTDPGRVIGFLDVAGKWDPSLALVMGGALGTFGLGIFTWRRLTKGAGWFGTRLPSADASPINRTLVVGATIFGVGWGISGFCPGPAIANLAAARIEALVFVPAMAGGMWLARVCLGADRD